MRPWPLAGRWRSPMTWLARSPLWPTYSTTWTAPQPPKLSVGEPESWAPHNSRRRAGQKLDLQLDAPNGPAAA